MYHHVVMFEFVPGTDLEKAVELLCGLKDIEVVHDVVVRVNEEKAPCRVFGSVQILLDVTLESQDDYEAYDTAEYHVKCVKPVLDAWLPPLTRYPAPGRWAFDYTDGPGEGSPPKRCHPTRSGRPKS